MNRYQSPQKPLSLIILFCVIVFAFFVSIFVRVGLRNIFVPFFSIEGNFQVYLSHPQHAWVTLLYAASHAFVLIAILLLLRLKFSFAPVETSLSKNKKSNLTILSVFIFAFAILYAVIFYLKGARVAGKGFYGNILPLLLILLSQALLDTYLHHRFFLAGILQRLKPEDALGLSAFLFGFYSLLLQNLVPLAFLNHFTYGALAAFLFWATQNITLLFVMRFLYLMGISFSSLHLAGYTVSGFIFIPATSGFIGGGYYGAEGSLLLTVFMAIGILPVYWFLVHKKKLSAK